MQYTGNPTAMIAEWYIALRLVCTNFHLYLCHGNSKTSIDLLEFVFPIIATGSGMSSGGRVFIEMGRYHFSENEYEFKYSFFKCSPISSTEMSTQLQLSFN